MADYFTNVSLVVPVTDPEGAVAEIRRLETALMENQMGDGVEAGNVLPPNPIFTSDDELYGLPGFSAERDGVWLYDTTADVGVVARIVCWLLTLPGAPDEFMFEWSSDCSKPRLDAFGGGTVLCTKDDWTAVHTASPEVVTILHQQLAMRQSVD